MITAGIALGSNVGNGEAHIQTAIAALDQAIAITARAPIFETEPVGMATHTPVFMNTAVTIETEIPPLELLRHVQAIEVAMGQAVCKHNANRIIDLDIIFYGDWTIHAPRLTIPHPRFRTRRFVLAPLVHIAPDWVDPVSGQSVQALFEALAA